MHALQLVFVVCSLLEGGGACRALPPIVLQEDTTLIGCVIASQVEAARYVAAHPNHQVVRATCEPAGVYSRL